METAKTMKNDFKGITATRKELREGRHLHTAKLIILRQWQQKKRSLTTETTITENSLLSFKNPKTQNNKRKKENGKENA